MILALASCQPTPNETITWSFETSGPIQSHPSTDGKAVYFGSNDSNFYAVDISNGKALWKVNTGNKVRSQAALNERSVFFTSGNNLFAIDKTNGEIQWQFIAKDARGANVLDPWDYHQGAPVLHAGNVYAGFGNGSLLGFDQQTGEEIFTFVSMDSAAIRSTPVIMDDVIYFGDWNGRIYAVNLRTADTVWTYRTYKEQPYPTFGQINTHLAIFDTLLAFGARNPEFQMLGMYSGKKRWSYTERDGGWLSGDPLFADRNVFIGGSDNHKMLAFNANTGRQIWEFDFLFNSFSKPVMFGDHILFTTGDAYASLGKGAGNGYLYAVNKTDGSLVGMAPFPGNIFCTPIIHDSTLFIAGSDSTVRAINLVTFLESTYPNTIFGNGPVEFMEVYGDSLTGDIVVQYRVKTPCSLNITVLNLDRQPVKTLLEERKPLGIYESRWNGQDMEGNKVADGYYFLEFTSGIFVNNTIVQLLSE